MNEAYDVLGDDEKRAEYDRLKRAPVRTGRHARRIRSRRLRPHVRRRRATHRAASSSAATSTSATSSPACSAATAAAAGRPSSGDPRAQRQNRGATSSAAAHHFQEAALGTKRACAPAAGTSSRSGCRRASKPGGACGSRARVRRRRRKGGVPGDLYLDIEVRRTAPAPKRRRRRARTTGQRQGGGAGREGRSPHGGGAVDGLRSARDVQRRTVAVARSRHQKPDGTRGDQICRIEIVAPKLDSADDAETRQLFEQIAQRTSQTPVRRF